MGNLIVVEYDSQRRGAGRIYRARFESSHQVEMGANG